MWNAITVEIEIDSHKFLRNKRTLTKIDAHEIEEKLPICEEFSIFFLTSMHGISIIYMDGIS